MATTFQEEEKRLRKALTDTLRIVSVETVKYFQDTMQKEIDIFGKPYKPRKQITKRQIGKRILQDTGNLKASIRTLEVNVQRLSIRIGTSSIVDDYAEKHNEGTDLIAQRRFLGESDLVQKFVEDKASETFKKLFK